MIVYEERKTQSNFKNASNILDQSNPQLQKKICNFNLNFCFCYRTPAKVLTECVLNKILILGLTFCLHFELMRTNPNYWSYSLCRGMSSFSCTEAFKSQVCDHSANVLFTILSNVSCNFVVKIKLTFFNQIYY